jgi:uncharacterized protein (TIGR03086 family)
MADLVALFAEASREFGARVHAVDESQWGAPTPDSEWTVADLVNHVIDEHRWMPPLLHGLDLESAGKVVEGTRSLPVDGGVGANLAQEWDEAATGSSDAVTEPGALERSVSLSRGPTPSAQYVGEMIADATVHAWDLGTAVGYREPLPDDLVSFVWEQFSGLGDLSPTGMFAPPVPVSDDAPLIDKLIAATGRNPAQ